VRHSDLGSRRTPPGRATISTYGVGVDSDVHVSPESAAITAVVLPNEFFVALPTRRHPCWPPHSMASMLAFVDATASFSHVVALTRARIFSGEASKDASDVPATTQAAPEPQATAVKEMSPLCSIATGFGCQFAPFEDNTSAAPEARCASVLPTARQFPPGWHATS
jgi:hypothetical protein